MFKAALRRVNATTLIAMLALTLATTGGAVAAGVIKITSIKQISAKVQKELRGKAGSRGASGANGAPGPAGAAGPAGTQGPAGPAGTNGVSVTSKEIKLGEAGCEKRGGAEFVSASAPTTACNGKEGSEGPEGNPWTPNSQLPEKATETGIWSFGPTQGSGGFVKFAVASFPIQLASALSEGAVHLIDAEGKELRSGQPPATPTQCGEAVGGTVAEPKAAPGNLCIYIQALEHGESGSNLIVNPATSEGGAAKSGALMLVVVSEPAEGYGTWAVTG